MLTIGLAGGSGSGKGTVASVFAEYGIPSIDTDYIYRKMTSPGGECIPLLAEEFGFGIILADGSLNRKALARIVFSEGGEGAKKRLEAITHKLILEEVRKILEEYRKAGKAAALVDAPLLFESGFDRECDKIIAVVADKPTRVMRIINRDKISEEQAKRRIEAQLPDDYIISKSDFLIVNNGEISELKIQIENIINSLLKGENKNG